LTAYTGHPILNGVLVGLSVLLVLGVGVYFRRRPTRLRQ
jgi:LPXTG-motif cell wall-anchored protein